MMQPDLFGAARDDIVLSAGALFLQAMQEAGKNISPILCAPVCFQMMMKPDASVGAE
ncbi:hypothetical protein JK202_13570 [Gluconobacter sp. Dm-62]|uniref:hypothetical protein n=1 Tax=Gluconobacter sp. Dm-62 TaxID=2799804 RepID=UPI001B8B5C04|nr:hypothetical protein [Gluconobacter sp. Dm-62]MBS1104023.1 hypothetical protein [Gluconobacter sp. Dm-62]